VGIVGKTDIEACGAGAKPNKRADIMSAPRRASAARDLFEYGMLCFLGTMTVSSFGLWIYASSTPDPRTGQNRPKTKIDLNSPVHFSWEGLREELFGNESGNGSGTEAAESKQGGTEASEGRRWIPARFREGNLSSTSSSSPSGVSGGNKSN